MTYRMDELPCGLLINNVAREAIELARKLDEPVEFDFNGVIVTALHDDEESAVVGRYNEAMRREADDRRAARAAWLKTPAGIAETKRKDAERAALNERRRPLVDAIQVDGLAPFSLLEGKRDLWLEGLKNNPESYGRAVYRFASHWAFLMEHAIANGATVSDIARSACRDADNEGITGFMYGCAVSILSQCWEHGDELRRWHNIDVQFGSEGEDANDRGGVLNPALISFGDKE